MTTKERKQFLKNRRQKRIVSKNTHLKGKSVYAEAGLFKQRLQVTRENKSINAPKSRFTAKVKKELRGNYKLDTHKHSMTAKPKEWIRLNRYDLNALKVLKKEYR